MTEFFYLLDDTFLYHELKISFKNIFNEWDENVG